MTMPHLGNCPHKPGTWCLPCVREEWERREAEADALRAKLSAAEARIGRLQREVMAWRECSVVCRDGETVAELRRIGGDENIIEVANTCDAHNDLTPPTADNNAAQPQKD